MEGNNTDITYTISMVVHNDNKKYMVLKAELYGKKQAGNQMSLFVTV